MKVTLLFVLVKVILAEEISECLQKCLRPIARLERSFHNVFNNYEKVCDMLENGAFCARKCSKEDQTKFHQYTTFYRIHCVDYEEDLEPHLPCLRNAAKDSDIICKDRCQNQQNTEKSDTKENHMKENCLSLECTTVCYFQEFKSDCPEAEQALLKVNIGQIHSIAQSIHPQTFATMEEECRQIHDTTRMRKKLLGNDE